MSQMDDLVERERIKIDTKEGVPKKITPKWAVHGWEVTLKYGRKKLSLPFFGAAGVNSVSAADVLSALCSDTMSVENTKNYKEWLAEFGAETSKANKDAYKSAKKMGPKVKRFLGPKFKEFCNTQH